ncbi:MAG TPA: hypothetical protein VH877_13540 [Polyangia bacterium]|jgi:hypothetical protein|nr:hypothetical protein [Polyangia bacterium]
MPFDYFRRLSRRQQQIYLESDGITSIPLPDPLALRPAVDAIETGLQRDDREAVERAANQLSAALMQLLAVDPVQVEILAVRPRSATSELHGLYTREDDGQALIRVWMRTARHRRVVAFRTFLRTLVHEFCHHLDYVFLLLGDSLHTEGFFKRESSLVHQLAPRPR